MWRQPPPRWESTSRPNDDLGVSSSTTHHARLLSSTAMTPPLDLEIPESFETERLIIRCPREGDGAEVNAAIRETFEALKPWMPWVDPIPTPEQTEERQRQARADFLHRTDLPLNLYSKASGMFVGGSGLHRMDWAVPRFEIGYWCRLRFQNQGFISEAVRGITAFAFLTLGANRVEIRCDNLNEPSRKVAERCGYTYEATLRNTGRRVDGSLRHTLVYSLIPAEFDKLYGNDQTI